MKRIIALILALVALVSLMCTTVFAGWISEPILVHSFSNRGFKYEFWAEMVDVDDGIDWCYLKVSDYYGSTLVNARVFPNGSPYKAFTMKKLKEMAGEAAIKEACSQDPYLHYVFDAKYDNMYVDTKVWEDDYDCVVPYDDRVNVTVKCVKNGAASIIKFPDLKPVIAKGTTLLPIRAIADYYGWKVIWDATNRIVAVSDGSKTVNFTLGDKWVEIKTANGENDWKKIPIAADIIGGRTVVPVRAVSECLGAQVAWDAKTYTVTITK